MCMCLLHVSCTSRMPSELVEGQLCCTRDAGMSSLNVMLWTVSEILLRSETNRQLDQVLKKAFTSTHVVVKIFDICLRFFCLFLLSVIHHSFLALRCSCKDRWLKWSHVATCLSSRRWKDSCSLQAEEIWRSLGNHSLSAPSLLWKYLQLY